MSKLVSPNDLFEAAKKEMLFGNEPITPADWILIVNFFAANIAPQVQPAALRLVCLIFDVPLPESDILKISRFQCERKGTR